jgi:hypothetical protein
MPDKPVVPVLVTNAPLFVGRYAPGQVSLATGQFEQPSAVRISPTDLVRFRKAFVSHAQRDLGERTILVVSAQVFGHLLRDLGLAADSHIRARKIYLS